MNKAVWKKARASCPALLLGVFLLAGCGYQLEGTRRSEKLGDARTISVARFVNQTNEPGLDTTVTNTLRRKFLRDGRLRVSEPGDADLSMSGVVRTYRLVPIAFREGDQARRYRLFIRARIRLRDNARGRWLIDQEVGSDAEFTVSSSIAQSGVSRSSAHRRAAESLAGDIVSLVLEGF